MKINQAFLRSQNILHFRRPSNGFKGSLYASLNSSNNYFRILVESGVCWILPGHFQRFSNTLGRLADPNMFRRPKAGFHCRQSHSRGLNQKRRAIRSSEIQTESRTLILLRTLSLTIKGTLHCWSRKQKPKNKPMTMFGSGPCDWLTLLLLLPTPTI